MGRRPPRERPRPGAGSSSFRRWRGHSLVKFGFTSGAGRLGAERELQGKAASLGAPGSPADTFPLRVGELQAGPGAPSCLGRGPAARAAPLLGPARAQTGPPPRAARGRGSNFARSERRRPTEPRASPKLCPPSRRPARAPAAPRCAAPQAARPLSLADRVYLRPRSRRRSGGRASAGGPVSVSPPLSSAPWTPRAARKRARPAGSDGRVGSTQPRSSRPGQRCSARLAPPPLPSPAVSGGSLPFSLPPPGSAAPPQVGALW